MTDNVVSIINIFTITFCVVAIATWWPMVRKAAGMISKWTFPTKLPALGMAIAGVAAATILVRLYSFGLREMGWLWLRDHFIAPALLLVQCLMFALLAAAYYLPRESGVPYNIEHPWRGPIAGAIAFGLMLSLKLVF